MTEPDWKVDEYPDLEILLVDSDTGEEYGIRAHRVDVMDRRSKMCVCKDVTHEMLRLADDPRALIEAAVEFCKQKILATRRET